MSFTKKLEKVVYSNAVALTTLLAANNELQAADTNSISITATDANHVAIAMPTDPNYIYTLQTAPTVDSTNWTDLTFGFAGTTNTLSIDKSTNKFFRTKATSLQGNAIKPETIADAKANNATIEKK